MKRYLLFFFIIGMIAFGSISISAQCDPNTASPIKCSYYNEGYQDGVTDAQSNRSNDYRRYRNKYNGTYESFYKNGYENGYDSTRGNMRWSDSQRRAYDSGYSIGQSDRRGNNQNRSAENDRGYDANIGLYFQQGYNDGFTNRSRQYDVPLATYPQTPVYPTNPSYPSNPGSGADGFATWAGRVDMRGNIILRGGTLYAENVDGNGTTTTYQNVSAVLPRRAVTVTARKSGGRGSVNVIQQPNRSNNYTAIIQVDDSKGGADNYKVDISWAAGSNVDEPFRTGKVLWSGRVDQTVNIIISGSDVQSQDTSGTGMSNVNFNISGYLARRSGLVTARKRNGRGTVSVLQQPSRDNDFTAIIQIFDPSGGSDNYDVEITW